jgi:erythromycin esterase-like protein
MLQKCALLVLFVCIIIFYSSAQEKIKDYVKEHSYKIEHINIHDSNFADLDVLGNAIGDTRIVALGEQMHGDGTTFEAKGRIIKYLHEKKGFNLIIFESDFFGLTYGFESLNKKNIDTLNNFIYDNVLGLWSWCNNANSFFYKYIAETQLTDTPLILAGMDCQNQSKYTFQNLEIKIKEVLSKLIDNAKDTLLAKIIVDNLSTTYFNEQKANPVGCENGLNALIKLLSEKSLKTLNDEEINLLNNVEAAYRNILPFLQQENKKPFKKFYYRDLQMYKNIMWLLTKKFPHEKAIIWAHNAHIMKHDENLNNDSLLMTGHYLSKASLNPFGYYSIGVTSHAATSIWTASVKYPIHAQPPQKNGYETWINKTWNFAFTSFKSYNQTNKNQEPFFMKGSFPETQHINYKYCWNKVFDGVFFIRNIEGCRIITKNELIKNSNQ